MCRFSTCLFFIFSFSTLLSAQEQRDVTPRLSPVITAGAAGETVRFSSPTGIAQIRVQIVAATGDPLFDSSWKDGNVLDWKFESSGQPLANGSYRCIVMVKDLDGRVTEREAALTARDGRISLEPRAGNEGVTVVEAEESGPKVTILVHDEKDGAIVSTSGDLSFRFGKFFAGKDSEKMRLTAEGNLEVDGVIHAKEIMFADGTVLSSAGGEAANAQVGGVNIPRSAVGRDPRSQPNATSRRLTPRLNAPAYQFVVDSLGVHIGTTSAYGLDVAGNVNLASNLALPATTATTGVITLGGSRFAHGFGTGNTFLGPNAGNFSMTGGSNTAIGNDALKSNTTGPRNTASGREALQNSTDGTNNVASGYAALRSNTTGSSNTADGAFALVGNTTGGENTASGYLALGSNSTGAGNTAIGAGALGSNTIASGNIGVGLNAGSNLSTGSDNIDIGNAGVAAESGTIRIGELQTRAFLAGVRDVTTGVADGLTVLIDSAGQLGTAQSSARVKRDIAGMGEQGSALMKLRPVSFFYRSDAVGFRQYGLIAEEVAEVMPELVQFSPEGEAETVRYHFLAPLLLDQVQKQNRQIEEQQKTIDALTQRLEALERRTASSQ